MNAHTCRRNALLDGQPSPFKRGWRVPASGILSVDFVKISKPDPKALTMSKGYFRALLSEISAEGTHKKPCLSTKEPCIIIFICVNMYICTHLHICRYVYMYANIYAYAYIYVMYIGICIYISKYIYPYIYKCIYIYICIYAYACMYMCVYIHVFM